MTSAIHHIPTNDWPLGPALPVSPRFSLLAALLDLSEFDESPEFLTVLRGVLPHIRPSRHEPLTPEGTQALARCLLHLATVGTSVARAGINAIADLMIEDAAARARS